MVIIRISRKPLIMGVLFLLLCSLGFNIYSYVTNMKITNRYQSVISIADQFEQANLISFVVPADKAGYRYEDMEIFDIAKGEVIKRVQSNAAVQKEVEGYLEGITGMYPKVKAFPDKGYIIRVPLDPAVKVKSKWLNDYGIKSVAEVFVLFPEEGEPYLLVLDKQKRPLFYNFEGNTQILRDLIP